MLTCKWCDQGVKLTGKDHWLARSFIPAKIKIVRCEKLKDRVEWTVASEYPRVTEGGYKNRAAAQRAADRANARSPEGRWRVEKRVIVFEGPSIENGCEG